MHRRRLRGQRASASPELPGASAHPVLGSYLVQCTCTTETRALLRHRSVTNCSEACEGTGSDLKMESFPIYRHHTHADVREVWHCVRKATGTVVTLPGRMTGCPR